MKLTERKLRGIIREEAHRLLSEGRPIESEVVKGSIRDLADAFHGSTIYGAKVSHGAAHFDLEGKVAFPIEGAKRVDTDDDLAPRIDPYEALNMLELGSVDYAADTRRDDLRLHLESGLQMVLMIPKNGTIRIEESLLR